MTEAGLADELRRALERHDAFEPADEATYESTTTPLTAHVTGRSEDDEAWNVRITVLVDLPTLDAVTEETVADVVEDGWFETLSLRLEDAYDAPDVDPVAEPAVERDDDRVEATFRFRARSADHGVEDAKAIVDFVEGTYVQGVIPGYTYQDPIAGLLSQARARGGDDGDGGAERGGTPL